MFTWKFVSNLVVPNEFHTLFFVEHGFDAHRKKKDWSSSLGHAFQ